MKQVLIVVDAQNDFIDGSLGSPEALKAVQKICRRILNFNEGLIITTMDTHGEKYLETKEGQNLPVEHCIKNTKGWSINKVIAGAIMYMGASGKKITYKGLEKPTFGCLDLIKTISEWVGMDPFTVTFVGYCTDICVITNALLVKTAFYAQADVRVDAQCCAGVTPEKHQAALEVMKSCQIQIINENEDDAVA